MVVSIEDYLSHPQKKLTTHIQGVIDGTKHLTNSKVAEWAAIFHDIGKLNPNFQSKLTEDFIAQWKIQVNSEYSHHAYLSMFAFICYCGHNQQYIKSIFKEKMPECVAAILTIIAYHHGNLPDFSTGILNSNEIDDMVDFIENVTPMPVSSLLTHFLDHDSFCISTQKNKQKLCENFPRKLANNISNYLDFFWETRFSFSCLIHADKSDAGQYLSFPVPASFAKNYQTQLHDHLQKFSTTQKINQIRTQMRIEACEQIEKLLSKNERIFALTAPTGSGKTFMLLSLAAHIMKEKPELKIIYTLPFLSISEQVEEQCKKIFYDMDDNFRRIDSKSENDDFTITQQKLDEDPRFVEEIVQQSFRETTFAYPFILTTFVRIFETLVSNRNATLLKLPNFANTIFLIDEIQALPPRLYGFFVAMLDYFCKEFNSYAIISTATMPNFALPQNAKNDLETFFYKYTLPKDLLSLEYFSLSVFNRYRVKGIKRPMTVDYLAQKVLQEHSALVIVNTIEDSKDLYQLLAEHESVNVILLNTHFTPKDRTQKIAMAKKHLYEQQRVIVISTQLIEAGVDIDFPVVYRDLCPLPSIVQSAGRCNRNGKRQHKGQVYVIELQKYKKTRAELIYRGNDSRFLNFVKSEVMGKEFEEPQLLELQKKFFDEVKEKTLFGWHAGKRFQNEEIDFVKCMKQCDFKEMGKFRLIDNHDFGDEYRYYIPESENDCEFENLVRMQSELEQIEFRKFKERKGKLQQIEQHLKKMAQNVVQIRAKSEKHLPMYSDDCFGIVKLLNPEAYSNTTGLIIGIDNAII